MRAHIRIRRNRNRRQVSVQSIEIKGTIEESQERTVYSFLGSIISVATEKARVRSLTSSGAEEKSKSYFKRL